MATTLRISDEILDFLEEFGLSEREVILYLALLKTGPNTIMNLSRETGIKRSTTHNNVEELIKKGLVSQTNYGERRMVIAEEPDKLKFLLDQKKYKVKKMDENLGNVVKQIRNLVPKSDINNRVEVKYIEGNSGIESIYKEALSSSIVRSYANLEKIFSVMPDNSQIFIDAHKSNSALKLLEIVEDSDASRKYAEKFQEKDRYEYRFAPKFIVENALDILLYDLKVVIINVESKVVATVIENKDYYLNTVAIFDYVWSTLKKS